MITKAKRILSIALAVCICLTMTPVIEMQARAYAATYPIPDLTGTQAENVAKIALSQEGYSEDSNGGTAYGAWWNTQINWNADYTYADWCAMFACWCSYQAGAGLNVAYNTSSAGVPDLLTWLRNNGTVDTSFSTQPKPGDFIFFSNSIGGSAAHVAIVVAYNSSTNKVTFVGGNQSNKVSKWDVTWSNYGKYGQQYVKGYGRPAYDGVTVGPHTCDKGTYVFNEAAHPHYNCYRCSICGQVWRNTAEPTIVSTCSSCIPQKPTVSTDKFTYTKGSSVQISWNAVTGNEYYWIDVYKDGTLIVAQSMANNTSYTLQSAEVGSYVIYLSANNSAGHSGSGSCSFSVVDDRKPETPIISVSNTYCKTGESITVSWQKCLDATSYIYYVAEHPAHYAYETYVKSGIIKENSVTFSDLPNGKYRIFVHAINAAGTWSEQSNCIWMEFYDYDYAPTATTYWNGHLYALYDGQMSWDLAQVLCEAENGHLVTITSEQENNVVKGLLASGQGDGYWIGARNDNMDDYGIIGQEYRWITGEAFTHSDWAVGEPNSEGAGATLEHFAEIRKSIGNQWNDVKHTAKNGFILEIDVSEYSPVATAVYENSKYLLFDKNITWTEAKAYSESIGGHLAKISSAEEDAAISDLLQKGNRKWYYIGAEGSNGTWTWCDGSAVPMNGTTANWSNAEGTKVEGPSGWGNHLMKYQSSGTWIGIPNFYFPHNDMSKIGFVCEIDNAVFAVNYDANGGHEAPSSQTKVFNEELTLSNTKPIRPGYTFVGWATDSSATVAAYQPGGSFSDNSDITLYAVWEKGCEGNGHVYDYSVTTNPTISVAGALTGTCSDCEGTTTVTLPKLTTTDYTYAVKMAATCIADGSATYTWINTTYGNYSFDVTLAETGHSYDNGKITVAATCTQNGVKTYTCSSCGDTYTDSIASTGHQYQYGVCIACGTSDPNDSTLSGTVTSFGSSTDTVTMCIYKGNSNTALRTLTIKNGSFMIVGLPAGEYKLSFSKQNHVTREYVVTLEGGETVVDAKICLLGDVTGDGKINVADTGKVYAHVKGSAELADYAFACADVSGDGKINVADTGRIYAHVKGTKELF